MMAANRRPRVITWLWAGAAARISRGARCWREFSRLCQPPQPRGISGAAEARGGGSEAMSFIAPILPDSAPFSALQRAWLDGFLAGLFGDSAAELAPELAAPQPAEDEAFPWHDPALPLDERLALAADRPPERQLMAAMGQLDCGQCGYLCQSYAEAISRGEETQLTRCVPGGKATSRALK